MKIRPEHYAHLRNALAPFAAEIPTIRAGILAEGKAKDVEMRLRWDLTYRANLTSWICKNIYDYCDDTHVDTALRAIMREIEVTPAPEPCS
jgi:hypothetical protein